MEATAEREIQEELGLSREQYDLIPTKINYRFVFGLQKAERAGSPAEYQVFLGTMTDGDNVISPTSELTGAEWLTATLVLESLSFADLKEVFIQTKELISPK